MADRQLFQLVTKVPVLSDVIGLQDTVGAVEQGKITLQVLKDLILLNLKVRIASLLVLRITGNTGVIMESDYPGVNIVSVTINGQVIKMSANIFDPLKTIIHCNTAIEGTGIGAIPFLIYPSVAASDTISLKAERADGTTGGAPTFTNFFVTILTYP